MEGIGENGRPAMRSDLPTAFADYGVGNRFGRAGSFDLSRNAVSDIPSGRTMGRGVGVTVKPSSSTQLQGSFIFSFRFFVCSVICKVIGRTGARVNSQPIRHLE